MSPTPRTPAERRLEELAAVHATRVLAYLARRTAPAEDVADVLQEVLSVAWRRIHDAPDDADHALAWLLAIARRTVANHRRGQLRRHEATQRLRDELACAPRARTHADSLADPGHADLVRAALGTLPEDDRELLTLTYWDGLTAEQVATVVGATAPTTRKRLQRARDRLRRTLSEEPGGPGQGRLLGPGDQQTAPSVRHGSPRGERALTRQ